MGKQSGIVYYDKVKAGIISRRWEGKTPIYEFEYLDEYFDNEQFPAIAFQFPKTQKKYISDHLWGFFDGMLAEGNHKKIQCLKLKIDEKDQFTRLLKTTAYEIIGMVNVVEIEE